MKNRIYNSILSWVSVYAENSLPTVLNYVTETRLTRECSIFKMSKPWYNRPKHLSQPGNRPGSSQMSFINLVQGEAPEHTLLPMLGAVGEYEIDLQETQT